MISITMYQITFNKKVQNSTQFIFYFKETNWFTSQTNQPHFILQGMIQSNNETEQKKKPMSCNAYDNDLDAADDDKSVLLFSGGRE